VSPDAKRQTAARKRMAAEIHIPLREMRDSEGGVFYIAPEMDAADLVVNIPDYVLMVHPPRDNKPPQLVLRMRVEE
jgi:hypothetical protein